MNRTRLGWLVEFMRLWFSEDELCNLARSQISSSHYCIEQLARAAQEGDAEAAYRLREQVWEVTRIGLGERLADGMQRSPNAAYLQAMAQALYTLAGAKTKLEDLPVEIQQLTDLMVQEAQKRLRQSAPQ